MAFQPTDEQIRFMLAIERWQDRQVELHAEDAREWSLFYRIIDRKRSDGWVPIRLIKAELYPATDQGRGFDIQAFEAAFQPLLGYTAIEVDGTWGAWRPKHPYMRMDGESVQFTDDRAKRDAFDSCQGCYQVTCEVGEKPIRYTDWAREENREVRLTLVGRRLLDQHKGEGSGLDALSQSPPSGENRVDKAGTLQAGRSAASRFTVSENGMRVVWGSQTFRFHRGNQAKTVLALWEAYQNERGPLHEKEIRKKIKSEDTDFRLAKLFRTARIDGKTQVHPAFKRMIVGHNDGSFEFVPPESLKNPG